MFSEYIRHKLEIYIINRNQYWNKVKIQNIKLYLNFLG